MLIARDIVTHLFMQSAEVVQYILVKDQKKIPVRRAGEQPKTQVYKCRWFYCFSLLIRCLSDLVKHVIKDYRNAYSEIMKRVIHTFEQVCPP